MTTRRMMELSEPVTPEQRRNDYRLMVAFAAGMVFLLFACIGGCVYVELAA